MKEEHEVATEASGKALRLCEHHTVELAQLWEVIRLEAERLCDEEPRLRPLAKGVILDSECLGQALSARLSRKLAREDMGREDVQSLLREVFRDHPELVESAAEDIEAIHSRDPACDSPVEALLFFKGFAAISTYRVSHQLWKNGRRELAYYFQSLASEVFAVDIHPAARIGCGVMLDHATSFVVGETAIIEDNVSILHEVTLGGTGKATGGTASDCALGGLDWSGRKDSWGEWRLGKGPRLGRAVWFWLDVAEHTTVAGVPAEVVGHTGEESPAMGMNQRLGCRGGAGI